MTERITQSAVDRVADRLLKEVGYDIEKVIPNQVAKALGKPKANGAIGEAVSNWKERRIADGAAHLGLAPPELDAALDEFFENSRRTVKGLVGKSRAKDVEKHEAASTKWSNRYDDLEARHRKQEEAFELKVAQCTELENSKKQLLGEVERLEGQLRTAHARLEDAHKMNAQLVERLQPQERKSGNSADSETPNKMEPEVPHRNAAAEEEEYIPIDMSRFDAP